MKYLCLIYQEEFRARTLPKDELAAVIAEFTAFSNGLKQSGKYVGSNALQAPDTATTVRVRNGRTTTTDGPYAETKEQLGGYYLIEAKDMSEATRIAGQIPAARWGSIEVRPIRDVTRPA